MADRTPASPVFSVAHLDECRRIMDSEEIEQSWRTARATWAEGIRNEWNDAFDRLGERAAEVASTMAQVGITLARVEAEARRERASFGRKRRSRRNRGRLIERRQAHG